MRAKRFRACLAGQMLRDLATGTCEGMDGNRIIIFKKQRQRSAELSTRDFNFVELHLRNPLNTVLVQRVLNLGKRFRRSAAAAPRRA